MLTLTLTEVAWHSWVGVEYPFSPSPISLTKTNPERVPGVFHRRKYDNQQKQTQTAKEKAVYLSAPFWRDTVAELLSSRHQMAIRTTYFAANLHILLTSHFADKKKTTYGFNLLLCVPAHLRLSGKLCRSKHKMIVRIHRETPSELAEQRSEKEW